MRIIILNLLIFFSFIINNKVFARNVWAMPGIPKQFIMQFLPKNPVILEAGAWNGADTVELAKLWPNSKIYAFEPIPEWYNIVKTKTKNFHYVTCYQLALSNKTGIAEFFLSSNSGMSSSLLKPEKHLEYAPKIKFDQSIIVKTITIDDWAKHEGVNRIDFMWLDIQGKEPEVLMASPKILKTVKVIYSEISREEMYKNQVLYENYKVFFTISRIY